MKIELEISEKNECTSEPWWVILNPGFINSIESLAYAITGPFFSREEAQAELTNRRYTYGKNAVVYCHSGYRSKTYKTAIRAAKNERA